MAGIGDYLSSYFYGSRTPDQQDVYNQFSDVYRRAGTPSTVKVGDKNLPFNRWNTQLAATQGQAGVSQPQNSGLDKLIQMMVFASMMGGMNKKEGDSGWWDSIKNMFSGTENGAGAGQIPQSTQQPLLQNTSVMPQQQAPQLPDTGQIDIAPYMQFLGDQGYTGQGLGTGKDWGSSIQETPIDTVPVEEIPYW